MSLTAGIVGLPNVGKSTLFNAITGMHQHTGNWPGKTVSNAHGHFHTKKNSYLLVDIPGTYSLMAHSAEEEVARNFICFGNPVYDFLTAAAVPFQNNIYDSNSRFCHTISFLFQFLQDMFFLHMDPEFFCFCKLIHFFRCASHDTISISLIINYG